MAKKDLFVNEIPGGVGGGTVTFVSGHLDLEFRCMEI